VDGAGVDGAGEDGARLVRPPEMLGVGLEMLRGGLGGGLGMLRGGLGGGLGMLRVALVWLTAADSGGRGRRAGGG
jgi:hypothetical protein